MVLGQSHEDHGRQGHPGTVVMADDVLYNGGKANNQPSSPDVVVEVVDTSNVVVSGSSGKLLHCPSEYDVVQSFDNDSELPSLCDTNSRRGSGASCDHSATCKDGSTVSPKDDMKAADVLSSIDGKSDCASYDDSDYTDSVGSTDSNKFLLPLKSRKDNVREQNLHDISGSNSTKPVRGDVSKNSESNTVIVAGDCYENKDYTDTIFSNASSTRPLLKKTDSLWSFVKEAEVSTPVIGLIDHPGFMSSQRDLSSNSNLSFACQKALQFLQDERVASSLLLSGSKKDISIESLELSKDIDDIDHNIVPSGRHTRNLISLTACITMVFIATGSLRNLQTSINHEGGVGVTGLAANFMGYMIGSIFSPFLVQNYHPYRALLASLLPHTLYIAANFYPVMWLMVPVSLLWGVSGAILWNAMSTYITFLAKGYSEKKKLDYEIILSRFFGIFYLVWQLYMIFGNLIASLVLTYAYPTLPVLVNTSLSNSSIINQTMNDFNQSNSMYSLSKAEAVILNSTSPSAFNTSMSHYTLCGAKYCHHYAINNTGTSVSNYAKYVLYGTYMGFMAVAVIIAVFLLEPLNRRLFSSAIMKCHVVKAQIVSLGQFVTNRRFLLLCPLLLFSQTQAAFANGEITKAFVTCPIGVHMVGYTMICMGVAGSGSAYLSSWLTRFLGRTALIATAAVLNLGLLAFMAIWQPTPDSLVVIFVLFGLWGIADGIWMAQSNCLMGVLFRDRFEEAFTGLRIMQGLGPAIVFAIAQSLCMATKIYIMGSVCVLAMAGYLLSEHLLKKELQDKEGTVYDSTKEV